MIALTFPHARPLRGVGMNARVRALCAGGARGVDRDVAEVTDARESFA